MGRFYVDLTLTVYADSEDDAERIGLAAKHEIEQAKMEEIGNVELGDIEDDSQGE